MIFATGVAHADRITDLQDSLDQLQDEMIDQQMMQMIRERNRSNPPNTQEQVHSFKGYKPLGEISGNGVKGTIGIDTNTVKKLNPRLYSVVGVLHFYQPQKTPQKKKSYVWHWYAEIFDCDNKNVISLGAIYLDAKFNIVEKFEFPSDLIVPVPWKNKLDFVPMWGNYVCKTYHSVKP